MSVPTIFRRGWLVGSVGVMAAVLGNVASGQVPPLPVPPATEAVQDATNTAQEAVQGATGTAQEAAKDATNTAQDATNKAQDAAQGAANTAQNAAQDATNTARPATQGATRAAQDAARDATNAARDTTRSATGAAQDATRNARGAAQDAARDVRGTARDVQGTARDAAQDVRGTAQDAARDIRGTAQGAARGARDMTRDAARGTRNAVRGTTRAVTDFRGADLGIWFDRSVRDGLVIADVAANAALGNIGFVEGDRIVSVGGQTIVRETDFVPTLLNARGRTPVVVLRDGQQQTFYVDPVVLREQIMVADTGNLDPLENFGIILDDRITDRLVIWRVIPRSPAFYAGLRTGDVITMANGQPLASADAFVQLIQQPQVDVLPLQITRNGRTRMIEADLQLAQRHTSARQDLDAGANVRTNETYIRSDVEADLQTPAREIPADAAPVLEPAGRPVVTPTYPTYRAPARRGLFRRR